jgi:hypothetical protein
MDDLHGMTYQEGVSNQSRAYNSPVLCEIQSCVNIRVEYFGCIWYMGVGSECGKCPDEIDDEMLSCRADELRTQEIRRKRTSVMRQKMRIKVA